MADTKGFWSGLGDALLPDAQPLDASRTYTWDMPDLPEILWDVNQAGSKWNESAGGEKIIGDLNIDKDYRNKLVQMDLFHNEQAPLVVDGMLQPIEEEYTGPSAGDRLLTTTDFDRLSSRMMGGGYFGAGRQGTSLGENLWESAIKGETEDLKNWGKGRLGRYKGLSPFEIMFADVGNIFEAPTDTFARSPLSGYRVDDQTITPKTETRTGFFPRLTDPISAIDSGVFDDQFTVNDRSVASTDPIEVLLQNNPGILDTTEQPINLGQTHADTLQSFFDIPEEPTGSLFGDPSIINENTLMMNSLIPISTGDPYTESGKVVIDEGVQTDYTPKLEPLFDIESLLADDHIDTTPVYDPTADAYLDRLNESFNPNLANIIYDSGVSGDLTPVQEAFDDYVERNVLGIDVPETIEAPEMEQILPSGPEDMYIPFEQDQETIDREAREEQIRLDKIMTKAREDRIRLEKQAENARQAKEADKRRARELREEAEEAEDRQDKSRLSREAEERDRQAKERAQEERNAVEAARLNALAEATEKINMAQKKKEEEAGRQQLKALEEFMARQAADRAFRKKQQASMPKSWAFF